MDETDFIGLWLRSELTQSRAKLAAVKSSYDSLKNRESNYARAHVSMIDVRERIVALVEDAMRDNLVSP